MSGGRYTSEMATANDTLQPLDVVNDLVTTAFALVSDLCVHKREWTMHIPPQMDDPDIAIASVLHQTTHLIAEVRRLRDQGISTHD